MEQILKYFNSKEQFAVAILAVFAVAFGKILEKFLKKDVEELDETLAIRKALREEVDALHIDVKQLREEVDSWRGKYWTQIETNATHQATIAQLKNELTDVRAELHEYKQLNLQLSEKLSQYFPEFPTPPETEIQPLTESEQ
jgi:chromosome segregation ATPase